ncbi:MAG: TonB family protein [Deltaproteobacteria bacterium]|nr:MAG: TonB family protein [Deltaproteobacteria bacterium]
MRAAAALLWAIALHVWLLAGLAGPRGLPPSAAGTSVAPAPSVEPLVPVALVTAPPGALGPPLEVAIGPADVVAPAVGHPLPRGGADLPGQAAASRGGGAAGGPDTYTGRRDGESLRAQPWSAADRYRIARRRTARRASSREALSRAPAPGWDDRRARGRRARAGRDQGAAGGAPVAVRPGGTLATAPAPSPARARPAAVRGDVVAGPAAPRVDRGPAAVESHRDGPARDAVDAVAASDERRPGPFELTRPRAGGRHDGVAGPVPAPGVAPRGRGSSTAAVRAALARARRPGALRARRDDPYFRDMYRRIDALVEFPRQLALSLEQGEVVVRFTLLADGSVADVHVDKSSGFAAFDAEVLDALRRAAPYGPVPQALLRGRDRVVVRAPYLFGNPIVR